MKKILLLFFISLVWTSCQDDIGLSTSGGDVAEGMVDIYLSQPDATAITTRAGEDAAENRIENVVLFVFDDKGVLLNTPVQQSVTVADGNHDLPTYKVRTYLPSNKSSLYAVCNYDEADGLIAKVNSVDALKDYVVEIESVEDAFKGVYVMEGYTNDFQKESITVPVTRIASHHAFTIYFDPENEDDQFKLVNLSVFNVPKKTKLLKDENYRCGENEVGCIAAGTDAASAEADYLGKDTDTEGDAGTEAESSGRIDIDFSKSTGVGLPDKYTAELNVFDNRRGRTEDATIDEALGLTAGYSDEDKAAIRQIFKKDLANGVGSFTNTPSRPYATCMVIEGIYEDDANNVSYDVKYYIYLGHNNYSDFNVVRNHKYNYTITIKACDVIDTRVDADAIASISFKVSKQSQPFDAHYNAREALLYCTTGWKVYVKNPDQTPWLEVSTSPVYKPRKLGDSGADNTYAQFSLSGGAGMQYIYIHTDEYVPDIDSPDGNSGKNKERSGTIVCESADGTAKTEFTVTQVPAQLVKVTSWDIDNPGTVDKMFFVERIEEERYKDWGFRGYWSLAMDNLISTGDYDGMVNTQKQYVMAYWGDKDSETFKDIPNAPWTFDGRQNAFYREQGEPMSSLSTTFALGYALSKNRDIDGSGLIDYDEIRWYLPAMDQLMAIYEAIYNTKTLDLELEGKTYWSSTPSVSDRDGITPGRAYYVDMEEGKGKIAIGLRSQSMGVIVCRDAGIESDNTGSGTGNVGTEGNWGDEEDVNMPKPDVKN